MTWSKWNKKNGNQLGWDFKSYRYFVYCKALLLLKIKCRTDLNHYFILTNPTRCCPSFRKFTQVIRLLISCTWNKVRNIAVECMKCTYNIIISPFPNRNIILFIKGTCNCKVFNFYVYISKKSCRIHLFKCYRHIIIFTAKQQSGFQGWKVDSTSAITGTRNLKQWSPWCFFDFN